MRARPDRRVAFGALVVAALATLVAVAASGDPPRPRSEPGAPAGATGDGEARAELLRLARARERGTWLVEFEFVRRLANGEQLAQRMTEASRPPLSVRASPTTVVVDFGDRVASCTATDEGPRCREGDDDPTLAPSRVYGEVTRLGAYAVEPGPTRTVGGEPARCFRLVAQHAPWPQLGRVAEHCYATDGVPLRSTITRDGSTDTRVAVRVDRDVTAAELQSLLERLEEEQDEAAG